MQYQEHITPTIRTQQPVRKRHPRDPEETALILRMQSGDPRAFDILMTRYRSRIAAIALKIVGNYEDANDIVQEVYIKVFNSIDTFDTRKRFYTWLYRMTTNASIDFWRKNRRQQVNESLEQRLEDSPQSLAGFSEDMEVANERQELHQLVLSLANSLSGNQKAAFFMCDIDGVAHDVAAEKLGFKKVTLRWYLHGARKAIRSQIRDRYPEYFRESTRRKKSPERKINR